jgi:hypothetical protein
MPTPTRTIFGTFNTTTIVGRPNVSIKVDLLQQAVRDALGISNTYSGTMRVFNLKHLYGFKYDFHLSFKLDPTAQWALGNGTHFCARDDARGKNFCLYWFYHLKQTPAGTLAWSYEGGAPDTTQNQQMREDVRIPEGTASRAASRFAYRVASQPLTQVLDKLNDLIGKGKAQLVVAPNDPQTRNLQKTG